MKTISVVSLALVAMLVIVQLVAHEQQNPAAKALKTLRR
jgi:hypothetical protein